jgi:Outer membrane protein Omp28/Secretion system C-terminal sorting domain
VPGFNRAHFFYSCPFAIFTFHNSFESQKTLNSIMKRIYSLLLTLFAFFSVQGQAYYYTATTGTNSPYLYSTTGTDLLTTGNQVLSSWQTLPFSWNFYGAAVTGYYATDNGYITFDNAASTSDQNNVALPAVGGPNHAIYAFWDDFTIDNASANPDKVRSWTYGTAPNRVHCIQWWSMSPTGTTTWIYSTIRIYESGDFDIVLDYSASTAGASTSGTIGCENAAGTDGTDVTTSPSITFPTLTNAANDDIVYNFHYGTQPVYDVSVVSSNFNGTCAIGNNVISGTLTNLGSATITSLQLNYKVNGGAPVSATLNSLSIAPSGGTYNYTHTTPWNVPSGGVAYALDIYADNLNGNADTENSNDTLTLSLLSTLGVNAPKVVMIEEFTGAWCQFCPDGVVVLNQIEAAHPDDVEIVSVHDGDGMEFAEGIRSAFAVSSYPSANVDRWLFSGETKIPVSRSTWSSYTTQRLNANSPVEVTVTNTYNSSTGVADVTVTADFVDYSVGDLRIGLMVTEDSVIGTGSGFNQVNYYNTTAGHFYYGAGNPIVGFEHDHVLRQHDGNAMGQAGLIPATAVPGGSYTYNTNITIPSTWNENHVRFVGYVYRYETDLLEGEILNSGGSDLGVATATETAIDAHNGLMGVFPNPTTGIAYASVEFSKNTEATVEVFTMTGQKVATLKEGNFAAGTHRIYFDASQQPGGIYFVTVKTAESSWTEKLVVTH